MHILLVAENKEAGCFKQRLSMIGRKNKKVESLCYGQKSEVTLLHGIPLSELCDGQTLPKPVMVSIY